MLVLPRELEKALSLDLAEFERERKMPYVSSIERIAREEGKAEGKSGRQAEGKAEAKVETLLRLLTKRLGTPVPAELEAQHSIHLRPGAGWTPGSTPVWKPPTWPISAAWPGSEPDHGKRGAGKGRGSILPELRPLTVLPPDLRSRGASPRCTTRAVRS